MRTADTTVGALAVICCATPLLITAIGTAALAAWLSKSVYVLIPAAVIAAGIGAVWFRRRNVGCFRPESFNEASQHE